MTWGEAAGTGVDPCPAVPTSDVPPWGCPEGDYWGGVEGRWFPVPNLVPPTLSLSPYSHPCALLFATSLQGTLGLVGGCWSCAPPLPPHPRATEPPGHCVPIIPNCSLGTWGRRSQVLPWGQWDWEALAEPTLQRGCVLASWLGVQGKEEKWL